jgi:hypothetical protein
LLNQNKIDAEYECSCWIEYDSSEMVLQSCPYHSKRLIMRSDARDFSVGRVEFSGGNSSNEDEDKPRKKRKSSKR